MSKPLIFLLQIIGLIMVLSGVSSDPINDFSIVIGAIIIIVAGMAFRRRIKKEKS